MKRAGRRFGAWAGWFSALAALALIVQLAVPPGFMLAPTAAGPAMVICTGHGPMMVSAPDRGAPAKDHGGKPAPMCPFAGHGGTPTVSMSQAPTPARFEQAASQPARVAAANVGQGLAAPPPPSRAPPPPLV
jgi:hypothetical protein